MTFVVWIWLGILVVSALLEFISLQMVSIWFCFSSVVAVILDLCFVPIWVQILVFVLLALILLVCLRRFCLKFLLKGDNEKTNVDTLVGSIHSLFEPIEKENSGSIKVNGVVWTAVSQKEEQIKKGEKVKIIKVEGNKLIVKKENKEETK